MKTEEHNVIVVFGKHILLSIFRERYQGKMLYPRAPIPGVLQTAGQVAKQLGCSTDFIIGHAPVFCSRHQIYHAPVKYYYLPDVHAWWTEPGESLWQARSAELSGFKQGDTVLVRFKHTKEYSTFVYEARVELLQDFDPRKPRRVKFKIVGDTYRVRSDKVSTRKSGDFARDEVAAKTIISISHNS
jgi:hypothetical protein